MSATTPTHTIPAEVRLFVAAVRRLLTDLPSEEAAEMTDGLEADLADLVAERGPDALGDPQEYVAELRLAAGLAPVGPIGARRAPAEHVHGFLDAVHERWTGAVDGLPGRPWEFVASLRPAWWIVRAWLALQLVDLVMGSGSSGVGLSLLPSLTHQGEVGDALLLLAAIVPSVALGRDHLWPTRRGAFGRVLLLALNTLAVLVVPVVATSLIDAHTVAAYASSGDGFQQGYQSAIDQGVAEVDKAGMYVDGKWITNIYPYDAHGRPLVGVQLLDQTGAPVTIGVQANYREQPDGDVAGPFVPYPWSNGRTEVRNVFPLAERLQRDEQPQPTAFSSDDPPRIGPFPVRRTSVVSLPGIEPSRIVKAAPSADSSGKPTR